MEEKKLKDWQFKPGNSGRPKGAANKITTGQKERVEWVLEMLNDTLEEDVKKLKAKERIELWSTLQEYIRPKLQRMNLDIVPPEDKLTKITFEVIQTAIIPDTNHKNLPIGEDSQGIRSIPEKL